MPAPIFLGNGNNVFNGAAGTQVVFGQGGSDTLRGGPDADFLDGGAANDSLVGNTGDDFLFGRGGSDTNTWNNGDGTDFFDGGANIDTQVVNGSAGATGDQFQVQRVGGEFAQFERLNLGQFAITLEDVERLEVNGLGGADEFRVGNLTNTDLDSIVFNGGAGADSLLGASATTPLTADGGLNNDSLVGGSRNDVFDGGLGTDSMFGGAGNDTFNITARPGREDLATTTLASPERIVGGANFDTVNIDVNNAASGFFVARPGGVTEVFADGISKGFIQATGIEDFNFV